MLVTAGPTREPIDSIRYIGNNSGGRLGYDLAAALLEHGATVFLVSGPVKVDLQHPLLTVEKVNTACEMYMACCRYFETIDIAVFAASLSDYRPKEICTRQINANEESISIKMVRNIDVAAAFANVKDDNQLTVGVTADPDDSLELAMKKMTKKNLDLFVLNPMKAGVPRYQPCLSNVSIIKKNYGIQLLSPLKSKREKINEIVGVINCAYEEKIAVYTEKYRFTGAVSSPIC